MNTLKVPYESQIYNVKSLPFIFRNYTVWPPSLLFRGSQHISSQGF
jgi:hypothetical protein